MPESLLTSLFFAAVGRWFCWIISFSHASQSHKKLAICPRTDMGSKNSPEPVKSEKINKAWQSHQKVGTELSSSFRGKRPDLSGPALARAPRTNRSNSCLSPGRARLLLSHMCTSSYKMLEKVDAEKARQGLAGNSSDWQKLLSLQPALSSYETVIVNHVNSIIYCHPVTDSCRSRAFRDLLLNDTTLLEK